MPPSKIEANLTLGLQVQHASCSLFPSASSCSNDYFREYAIIDFLANQLVFLFTVTYYGVMSEGGIVSHTKTAPSDPS